MHTMVEILDELVTPDSELHILSVLEAEVREERLRSADMRPPQNMRLQHFVGSHVQRTDLHKLAEHCGPEGLVSIKQPASAISAGHCLFSCRVFPRCSSVLCGGDRRCMTRS